MDARHKGMWTYVYRGYRRTTKAVGNVHPKGVPLPWNEQPTHSSGNPDGAIRSVANAYRIAPAQSLEGERLNGIHHRDKLRSVCHASTLRVVRHLLRIVHFLLHELGMNDILTVLVFAGRAMLYVTDWPCSSWHNLMFKSCVPNDTHDKAYSKSFKPPNKKT